MAEATPKQQRMTELLDRLATAEGIHPSNIEGVSLMRASRSIARSPVLYDPSIVIVGQGRKTGYLGNEVYTYDPHNYLVLTVPMPFECETEVGEHGPMLALKIRIDVAVLGELIMSMDPRAFAKNAASAVGMYATPMDEKLTDAAVRLLECMTSQSDAVVLAPHIVREITYRVLCGERGGALRDLLALQGRVGQLQRAIQRMHAEYSTPLDIQTLADDVGISPSAFHHNFKALTATSPLQYLKTIRLHKAKMLMVQEDISASAAAERVGYESPSQFSREFKRLFGAAPLQEVAKTRALLGLEQKVLVAR